MTHHEHGSSSESTSPRFRRHCDVVVIGGSAAGLAAALQLGRQRRSVIVVDSGEPRNAPAEHMHSFLGRDGTSPAALLDDGRADVRNYGVEVLSGRAQDVTRHDGRFLVALAEGTTVLARRVIVATGIADELPDVEGIQDHWGRAVFQCPFCHGYEVRDQRLIHLVTHPAGLHPAPLVRQLTDRLTVVIADAVAVDNAALAELAESGVEIRTGATSLRVVSDVDGGFTGVELADGTRIEADAMLVGPRFRPRVEPFSGLGLRVSEHPTGMGEYIEVDPLGATSVDGVHAAGSFTDPSQQVLVAAAHGSRVGAAVAVGLAKEDLSGPRSSGAVDDWDGRYAGEQIWSGNPNGSLVDEVAQLTASTALDIGAGEGGDAVWLAEQGWTVTASDISSRALERIDAQAQRRHLDITCLQADANGRNPYRTEADDAAAARFDLVSAAYASIPRTPDLRGVHTVIDAVAPGGSLVILSHDPAAMRQHDHVPFDPDAYIDIDDFARALAADERWAIEVNDKRARPAGSASAHRHPDDRVLRARRLRA